MSREQVGKGGVDRGVGKKVMASFVVAATAVCAGGVTAMVALAQGASMALALLLMAGIVVGGVTPALIFAHRVTRRTAEPSPTLLEKQLSARYGVPVRRLAFHVWEVNGELVEATFDTSTGYLCSGGRELPL